MAAPIRATVAAVREALANDGIRRLELIWSIGIAADAALLVALLVVVYARDGAVAAGVLGAVRMGPAVLAGMLAATVVRRFGGRRVLLGLGLTRAAVAMSCAVAIGTGQPVIWLYVLAAAGAVAGAPVRPAAATLMPELARAAREPRHERRRRRAHGRARHGARRGEHVQPDHRLSRADGNRARHGHGRSNEPEPEEDAAARWR